MSFTTLLTKWSVRLLVIITVVIAVGVGCYFYFKSKPTIEHIVLISLDTCRSDYLSCYGYPRKTTPNIDAVAKEGILFENVISPVPLTLPAHSSMMTGTIPPYHGVHDNAGYVLGPSNITLAERLKDEGFSTAAVISAFVLDHEFGLAQGFDTYDDRFDDARAVAGTNERRARETSEHAIRWLEKNAHKHSFLFLHYYDPHWEYDPPEPYKSDYADTLYAGEIAYTDYHVGRVIDALKKLGIYDSTLLIITGDHGEMLGEHGELTHDYFVYQSAVKVPLIFKLPGHRSNRRINSIVGLVDIMPTVCSLLQIETPKPVHGQDLSGLFGGNEPANQERYLYCESLTPTQYNANSLLCVVNDQYKYIQTTRPELFDLVDDPAETKNLAETQKQRARIMQDELKQILEMQVRKDAGGQKVLDEESLARLESLGYVAGSGIDDSLQFDQSKPDPKDLIDFHELNRAAFTSLSEKNYEKLRTLCNKMLDIYPDFLRTHFYLGKMASDQGDIETATSYYLKFIGLAEGQESDGKNQLNMELALAYSYLGYASDQKGQTEPAVEYYKRALAYNPNMAKTNYNLGTVYTRLGLYEKAIWHLSKAIELEPNGIEAMNNLGWILCMIGDDKLRDPAKAVVYLERASKLTHYKIPDLLDSLAAAYAAKGDFFKAVKTAENALVLAKRQQNSTLAQKIQARLRLYQSGKPYQDPSLQ